MNLLSIHPVLKCCGLNSQLHRIRKSDRVHITTIQIFQHSNRKACSSNYSHNLSSNIFLLIRESVGSLQAQSKNSKNSQFILSALSFQPIILWTDRFIKFKFTGIADADDNGTLDGIAVLGKGHAARNSVKVFNGGQGIAYGPAIFSDIAG